jgi:uncharacterized protein DUF4038/collagenase-like protein with putative collagen-binding domain
MRPGRLLALAAVLTIAARAAQACPAPPDAAFPLEVQPGQRYLVGRSGQPFLLNGDTAWSLIADLTREDAELYLRDRRARGFNTLLVNLLESKFARNAPANAYGDRPFTADGDYATPNDAYFDHAEWVLRRACELGFVVLLTPSYVGNGGGDEGWYREMTESGTAKLRAYGRYVGGRFGDLDNIVWVEGGDYNPPDKDLIRALADGIRESDPDALQTAHGSPGSAALEYWSGEPWLSINNVYTYAPVYEAALDQYAGSKMPFFLIESAYENEHEAGGQRVRMQAWQALLSGASGQIFGNNPIWHFEGPGIYPVTASWQQELGSPGARSMTVLHQLVASLPWWLLRPDASGSLLTEGQGGAAARGVAALAADGSFALVYLPTARRITLDLAGLRGPRIAARWHDPSTGEIVPVDGSPFPVGTRAFAPMPWNRAGASDWVLELASESDGKTP